MIGRTVFDIGFYYHISYTSYKIGCMWDGEIIHAFDDNLVEERNLTLSTADFRLIDDIR